MSEYRRLLEQAADTHGLLPELLELYGANETLRAELTEARRQLNEASARIDRLRDDVHYAWTTERECRGRLASIEDVCRKLVARRNNDDGYTVLTVDLQTLDELLAATVQQPAVPEAVVKDIVVAARKLIAAIDAADLRKPVCESDIHWHKRKLREAILSATDSEVKK